MFRSIAIVTGIMVLAMYLLLSWQVAWLIFSLLECILFAVIMFARLSIRPRPFPDLSDTANYFLRRYAFYYTHPYTARDLGSTTAIYQWVNVALALLALYHRNWEYVFWGCGGFIAMGWLGSRINPEPMHKNSLAFQFATDEILDFFDKLGKQASKQKEELGGP